VGCWFFAIGLFQIATAKKRSVLSCLKGKRTADYSEIQRPLRSEGGGTLNGFFRGKIILCVQKEWTRKIEGVSLFMRCGRTESKGLSETRDPQIGGKNKLVLRREKKTFGLGLGRARKYARDKRNPLSKIKETEFIIARINRESSWPTRIRHGRKERGRSAKGGCSRLKTMGKWGGVNRFAEVRK